MFSMAMWMIVATAPLQILAGDFHGLNTLEHQPAKIAAMEGHFESHHGAPLILFGLPDSENERVNAKLEIPQLGSIILKHDPQGLVRGLKEWSAEQRPPVGILFWSFRIMVGIGMAMLGIGLWSLLMRARGRLYQAHWLHRAALLMGPSGFVAVLAGWITTEVGRQPYTVYGLLTTAQSVSAIDSPAVGSSLLAFIVIYFSMFGAGTFYILRLMNKAPQEKEQGLPPTEPIRAAGIMPSPVIASAEGRI